MLSYLISDYLLEMENIINLLIKDKANPPYFKLQKINIYLCSEVTQTIIKSIIEQNYINLNNIKIDSLIKQTIITNIYFFHKIETWNFLLIIIQGQLKIYRTISYLLIYCFIFMCIGFVLFFCLSSFQDNSPQLINMYFNFYLFIFLVIITHLIIIFVIHTKTINKLNLLYLIIILANNPSNIELQNIINNFPYNSQISANNIVNQFKSGVSLQNIFITLFEKNNMLFLCSNKEEVISSLINFIDVYLNNYFNLIEKIFLFLFYGVILFIVIFIFFTLSIVN